jgi:hypothetical protein
MRARLRQIKTAMPQTRNGGGGKALRHAHTPPFLDSPLGAVSPMRLGTESRGDLVETPASRFDAYQEYWGSEKTI